MSAVVYHHTDTGRLPHILLSGELRPGRNRIGGYPDPDFLWATTSPLGDRTASASAQAFRSGLTQAVRFVLRANDFETWPEMVRQFPAWTPDQIARLEHAARGQSRSQDWRCRVAPLPAEAWLKIETRSYTDPVWRPLDLTEAPTVVDADTIGVWIGDKIYISTPFAGPNGSTGYSVRVGTRAGAA